jgi:hypothetical protein
MLELIHSKNCRVLTKSTILIVFRNGKPFPKGTVRCVMMEEVEYFMTTRKKRPIIACPLCGEQLPESPQEILRSCPSCHFDLTLVGSDEQLPVPTTEPIFIPQLVYWLLGLQMVVSGIFSILFFFFASSLYTLTPQLIALIQIMSIVALALFVLFLRKQKGITLIRIGLVIVGIISLPPGVLAIGASLGISPEKRRCAICRKIIRLTAYTQCTHCQASMHRWGSCRNRRLEAVATSSDAGTSITQIEVTCPICFKEMQPNQVRRQLNG